MIIIIYLIVISISVYLFYDIYKTKRKEQIYRNEKKQLEEMLICQTSLIKMAFNLNLINEFKLRDGYIVKRKDLKDFNKEILSIICSELKLYYLKEKSKASHKRWGK